MTMWLNTRWRALERVPMVRTALFVIGCLLLIATPFVGVLPGPGGIVLFGAGAALVLKYSAWAKRRYVRFKKKHPMKAAWADWSLRRGSARRREERERRRRAREAAEAAARRELLCLERPDGGAKLVLLRQEFDLIGWRIERRFDGDGLQVRESYWAVIGFSGPYPDVESARSDGLRALARA
jgi:hypothetical protein